MNIKEAIEKLKRLELKDFGKKRKFDLVESEVAYMIILKELKRKDKVIDMMAERIAEDSWSIENDSCGCIGIGDKMWLNDEQIKEYFYKKAGNTDD